MPPHPTPPAQALRQQDLQLLVCPVCHAALELEADAIRCTACSRRYPILDGLPVLLAECARPLHDDFTQ